MLRLPLRIVQRVAFLEVAARAKGALPRAGENDASGSYGICSQAGEERQQVATHLRIDGICRLRSVEQHLPYGSPPVSKSSN